MCQCWPTIKNLNQLCSDIEGSLEDLPGVMDYRDRWREIERKSQGNPYCLCKLMMMMMMMLLFTKLIYDRKLPKCFGNNNIITSRKRSLQEAFILLYKGLNCNMQIFYLIQEKKNKKKIWRTVVLKLLNIFRLQTFFSILGVGYRNGSNKTLLKAHFGFSS